MISRLAILLVLLQCNGPIDQKKIQASYVKYVPGAGGGKGITFTVKIDSLPGFELLGFEVNEVSLPAKVRYNSGKMSLQVTKFYPDKEAALADSTAPTKAPLYNAGSFEAVIHYSYQKGRDSLRIRKFNQEESPLYP